MELLFSICYNLFYTKTIICSYFVIDMKDLINEICYCLITGVRIIKFQMTISLAQFCTESKQY